MYIDCAPQHEQEVLEKLGQLKEMVTKQLNGKETQLAVKTLEDYTDREPICVMMSYSSFWIWVQFTRFRTLPMRTAIFF